MSDSYVLPLLTQNIYLDVLGGKGRSLAKMAQAGFAIPDGYYVNRRFTNSNDYYIKTDVPNGAKMFVRVPLQTKMEPDFDTGNVRFKSRERNVGWRIDYFIVSSSLRNNVVNTEIHNEYFGSDHCPISLDLSF